MKNVVYIKPDPYIAGFTCPHCNINRDQKVDHVKIKGKDITIIKRRDISFSVPGSGFSITTKKEYLVSICIGCEEPIFWMIESVKNELSKAINIIADVAHRDEKITKKEILYPLIKKEKPPAIGEDIDDDIVSIYNEAYSIIELSPVAACAMLRICIEKIIKRYGKHTFKEGTNIDKVHLNNFIENIKSTIPLIIYQTLHIIRIIGNGVIHDGRLMLDDPNENKDMAYELANFIPLIVSELIIRPKYLEELHQKFKLYEASRQEKNKNILLLEQEVIETKSVDIVVKDEES
jgi:hypothetical protein